MFGAFIAGAIVLTMAVAVGLVIMFFLQRDKQQFGFRTLFTTYFYLVAVISLLAAFFGASYVTKAVASDIFGRDFSYYNYEIAIDSKALPEETAPDVDIAKQKAEAERYEKERIESQYQEDLYNGISMLVVGLLFLGVHVFGWHKMETAKERKSSILYRAYVIVQLVIFSIITLVSLPMALGNSLRYWLQSATNGNSFTPGEPLSIALWSTPIWIYFVWLTIRTMRHQEAK